jgi:hypothetical protein
MGLASFRLPWADFLFPKNEIAIIANRFLIKKKPPSPFPSFAGSASLRRWRI